MNKFTVSENETRKSVFTYIRKKSSYLITQSDLKSKFGSSKLVKAAITEAQERIRRNAPAVSHREQFLTKLRNNADNLARCLPESGHRMGEFKYIINEQCQIRGTWDHTQEYATSCQWRAKHGTVEMKLPISLIGRLEAMEGVMTLRGKQIQQGIWKCEWLVLDYTRNGRGFINSEITYHMQKGYVVRREEGRRGSWYSEAGWYHTTDIADARQHLKQFNTEHKEEIKWQARTAKQKAERDAAREKEMKRRERQQAKEKREMEKSMKRVAKSAEVKDAIQHMYVYQDSIKAGNCIPGTDGFLAAHNLQKTDTRSGEFLLRISRDTWQHDNVVRIILHYIRDNHNNFYLQNERLVRFTLNQM